MSIGTFTHTWKVTKIQKFGSKTIPNSTDTGSTSYTDLVCGVWATLITTNQHPEHDDPSHYVERNFVWQWKNKPVQSMDPVGFVTYANLTESDYVNILKNNGCAGVEDEFEKIFTREFVSEPIDVVDNPFGYTIEVSHGSTDT